MSQFVISGTGLFIPPHSISNEELVIAFNQYVENYNNQHAAEIEAGEVGFEELEKFALSNGEPTLGSGRQEMLENLLNEFI